VGKGGLIAVVALAACAAPVVDTPAARAIQRAEQHQAVGVRAPASPAADMCRAGDLQWLVGRPKTDIPVPVDVVTRRVTCSTCPVTEDFSPYRLNILFNEQTGIVEQVRCG